MSSQEKPSQQVDASAKTDVHVREQPVYNQLFTADPEQFGIKLCVVDEQKNFAITNLISEADAQSYLSTFDFERKNQSNFVIIPQLSSRGSLDITSKCFETYFDRSRACPATAKIFDAFLPDAESLDFYVGRGAAHFSPSVPNQDTKRFDICCVLKYVQENDRGQSGPLRWSIRQMGFCQSFRLDTHSETTTLVNPSAELWRRLKTQLRNSQTESVPWEHSAITPLLVLESLTTGWSEYLLSLHNRVTGLMNDASFYTQGGKLQIVDTDSLRQGLVFKDCLNQTMHVLQTNRVTLEAILSEVKRRQHTLDPVFQVLEAGIIDTMRELSFLQNQAQFIVTRLDQTTALYRDVATTEGSNLMGQMTAKSILEARAVRVIALLTFLFLPPTFTAGFLEMGYINVSSIHGGHIALDVNLGLVFWVIITLPLMVITVGGWLIWDWRSKRKSERHLISAV